MIWKKNAKRTLNEKKTHKKNLTRFIIFFSAVEIISNTPIDESLTKTIIVELENVYNKFQNDNNQLKWSWAVRSSGNQFTRLKVYILIRIFLFFFIQPLVKILRIYQQPVKMQLILAVKPSTKF